MDKKLDKLVQKAKNAFKWLAVDEDGDVTIYEKKPKVEKNKNWWYVESGNESFIDITNDEELKKNWKKTLRRIR